MSEEINTQFMTSCTECINFKRCPCVELMQSYLIGFSMVIKDAKSAVEKLCETMADKCEFFTPERVLTQELVNEGFDYCGICKYISSIGVGVLYPQGHVFNTDTTHERCGAAERSGPRAVWPDAKCDCNCFAVSAVRLKDSSVLSKIAEKLFYISTYFVANKPDDRAGLWRFKDGYDYKSVHSRLKTNAK